MMDLEALLNGELSPPSDEPIHVLEPPSYRRDGLYGATPFKTRPKPVIVALIIEQACKHCGSTHLSYGGVFREELGNAMLTHFTVRNRIGKPVKTEIERIVQMNEEIPFCPNCLGKGDVLEGDSDVGSNGAVETRDQGNTAELGEDRSL